MPLVMEDRYRVDESHSVAVNAFPADITQMVLRLLVQMRANVRRHLGQEVDFGVLQGIDLLNESERGPSFW